MTGGARTKYSCLSTEVCTLVKVENLVNYDSTTSERIARQNCRVKVLCLLLEKYVYISILNSKVQNISIKVIGYFLNLLLEMSNVQHLKHPKILTVKPST